jgi:hypothetical protein
MLPTLVTEALERDRDRQHSAATEVNRSLKNYVFKCLDQVAENPLTEEHRNQIERELDKFVRGIQKCYGDYARLDEYLRQTGAYNGRGEAPRPPT